MDKFEHGGNIYRFDTKKRSQLLDFSANINPIGLSTIGVSACKNWMDFVRHYPEPNSETLLQKLADFYAVSTDNTVLGNGATELLYLLMRMLSPKRVFICAPTFSEYARAAYSIDIQPTYVSYDDIETLINKVSKEDLVCICSPNNPDGRILNVEEKQFLLTLENAGVYVLVDESFIDFNPELTSMRNAVVKQEHLFVLQSMTKFWGVPGLRIGALFAAEKWINKIKRLKDIWSVNAIVATYMEAALTDTSYYKKSQIFMSQERPRIFEQYTNLNGVLPFYPYANFMLLQLADYINPKLLTEQLEAKNILIRLCDNYPNLEGNYVRIAIKNTEENDILYKVLKEEVRVENW